MPFNPAEYEPVEERLAKFWADHPNGRVWTDQMPGTEPNEFIFLAEVYRDMADERPASTGWAQEFVGTSQVNKTSALENCETSAIGRALANLGYAPKGKRPSREEMQKTQAPQAGSPPPATGTDDVSSSSVPASGPVPPASVSQARSAGQNGPDEISEGVGSEGEADPALSGTRDSMLADLELLAGSSAKALGHINATNGTRFTRGMVAEISEDEIRKTLSRLLKPEAVRS